MLTTHMDSATIATFAEAYDNQRDILPPKKSGNDASGSNLHLASRYGASYGSLDKSSSSVQ